MSCFPQHCHLAELAKSISGIGEEVDLRVVRGDGVFLGGIKGTLFRYLGVGVEVSCVVRWVIGRGSMGAVILWELEGVNGSGASDGGVYCAFNAGL